MWFRKKAPIFLECTGCGCLMRRARKKVEVEWSGLSMSGTFAMYGTPQRTTEPYCGRCAPPYDVTTREGGEVRYYRNENVEVTEKGKLKGGE